MKSFITIKEAADILGVSSLTLRRWDQEGKLKARRNPFNNYRMYGRKKIESIAKKINSTK